MSVKSAIWGNKVIIPCVKGESLIAEFEYIDKVGTNIDMTQWNNSFIGKKRARDLDATAPMIVSDGPMLTSVPNNTQKLRLQFVMDKDNSQVQYYKMKSVHKVTGQVLIGYFGPLPIQIT